MKSALWSCVGIIVISVFCLFFFKTFFFVVGFLTMFALALFFFVVYADSAVNKRRFKNKRPLSAHEVYRGIGERK